MKSDKIGIVVIGRNEGRRLVDCLTSLKKHRLSVIYVDSGSTDDSANVAEKFGTSVVRLTANKPFTAARARNEGFFTLMKLEPNTKFVQFIDGDCELVSSWLDTALQFITKRNDVAVVCGRRRERYPERSVYNRLCDIEWNTPVGEASECGGDSLVRVDAFKEVGGFQSKFVSGEEPELCGRLRERGWKVWRLDAEMTRHDAAMTQFSQWWRRAVRGGYGEAEIAEIYLMSGSAPREKKAVARSIIWAGIMPIGIITVAFFQSAALLGVLIYPLQVVRIALRRGVGKTNSWIYALFNMIGKFAQLQGNLKYFWDRWRGHPSRPIQYKLPG